MATFTPEGMTQSEYWTFAEELFDKHCDKVDENDDLFLNMNLESDGYIMFEVHYHPDDVSKDEVHGRIPVDWKNACANGLIKLDVREITEQRADEEDTYDEEGDHENESFSDLVEDDPWKFAFDSKARFAPPFSLKFEDVTARVFGAEERVPDLPRVSNFYAYHAHYGLQKYISASVNGKSVLVMATQVADGIGTVICVNGEIIGLNDNRPGNGESSEWSIAQLFHRALKTCELDHTR
jgi:hypothetical protein